MKKYLAGIIAIQFVVITYLFQQRADQLERIKESAEAVAHSTRTLHAISETNRSYELQLMDCRSDLSKYRELLEQKQQWP